MRAFAWSRSGRARWSRCGKLWWKFFVQCGAMFYAPAIRGKERSTRAPSSRSFSDIAEAAPPLTAAELLDAWAELDLLRAKMLEEMSEFPVLLCPVASIPAFRHGEREWVIEGQTVEYLDAGGTRSGSTRWPRRRRWFLWAVRLRACRSACRLLRGRSRMRRRWRLRRLWMRRSAIGRRPWRCDFSLNNASYSFQSCAWGSQRSSHLHLWMEARGRDRGTLSFRFPRNGAHRVREDWHERFAETPDVLKSSRRQQTVVPVLDLEIGGGEFITMAGPCSVETEFQLMATANHVRRAGRAHSARRRIQAAQFSLCISRATASKA